MPKLLDQYGRQKIGRSTREFTLATWPPDSPYRGEKVVLADTYDGVAFRWEFIYADDEDATYPWKAATNQTSVTAYSATDNVTTASAPTWEQPTAKPLRLRIPRAGVWNFDVYACCHNFTATRNSRIGVSDGSAAPASYNELAIPLSPSTAQNAHAHLGSQLTVAAGDYRYHMIWQNSGSGQIYWPFRMIAMKPVKIA